LKASETKLQEIIEGTKQYVVPLFQRSYSWTEKEWKVLLDDLIELCEEDNPRTHFVGSIVTMPTTSVPQGVPKYLLIDGQQRLTTFFILLTLIRDQCHKNNQEELGREINDTLLVNSYKKELDYFKLQPTNADRLSFQQLIKPEYGQATQNASQTQIQKAYDFFEKKFRQGLDIEKLKKIISSNLSIVSIVLDLDDDPYLVFESLNAKGRPLTQADLIRNYFFMKIHVGEQERIYAQYWQPMQEALGEDLTECIRHYLMRGGSNLKKSDIYFSLKDSIKQGDALDHLKTLARFAEYYQKLLKPEKEPDAGISKALARLNRIEVTTAYPFLLNCYDDYSGDRISAPDFARILAVLENFMIRRFVCNQPTNLLNSMFPVLYSQVKNKVPNNFLDGLKDTLQTRGYPKDLEFKARLGDAKLYGGSDRGIKTKLILESIEESYNHKESVDSSKLTIEHIMPQTLTEVWQKSLGDDWEIDHDLLLHTLGNLTLTAYNSELSNNSIESKKKDLAESHLEINKYFKDKQAWTKLEIEQRSEELADICINIWPYFGEEKVEQKKDENVTGTTPTLLWILGQQISVKSWRDVFEETLTTIAELEPEKFDQLMKQYPHIITKDKAKLRRNRQLKNGVYIEVKLAAKTIQSLCHQMLQFIDLTTDDWKCDVV